MSKRIFFYFVLSCVIACGLPTSQAGEVGPLPRISEEAFKARLPFFDYDKTIPLEGRVVRQWAPDDAPRQKIAFRGAQGFLVPGYVEFPKSGRKPCPLVMLL